MSPIDTDWFHDLIQSKGTSQRKLAKHMGLDPAAVSLMFRGKRKITLEEAAEMSRLLGVPLDDVLDHAGVKRPPAPNTTAIVGVLNEDGDVVMGRVIGPKRVELPVGLPDNVCAVRVVSQRGYLADIDGTVLYFVPSEGIAPEAMGRWSLVKLASGATVVRVLKRGYTKGKWSLISIMGLPPMEDVAVAAATPVLWMKL